MPMSQRLREHLPAISGEGGRDNIHATSSLAGASGSGQRLRSLSSVSVYPSVSQLPQELDQYRDNVARGERLLHGATIGITSLVAICKPALQYLCRFRQLDQGGTRQILAQRLISQVVSLF